MDFKEAALAEAQRKKAARMERQRCAQDMHKRGVPIDKICESLGVSRRTVQSYIRGAYDKGKVRVQHKAAVIEQARQLAGDGEPLEDIMESVGIKSSETMVKYLKAEEIPYLTVAQKRRAGRRDEALALYREGMTLVGIGRRLGVQPQSVYSLLPRDVRRRVLAPSRRVYKVLHGMSRKRPPAGPVKVIEKPFRPIRRPEPRESVRSMYSRGLSLARIADLRGRTLDDVRATLRRSYGDNVGREAVHDD